MYDLLNAAISKENNEEFTFFLSGDLCQMSSQRTFLNSRGIQTKQNNVYPCVRQSDVSEALRLIWINKVDGWWHYKDDYILHSICTNEEFMTYLKRS